MSSSDQKISVLDLASQLGRRKQTVFKILKRLGIETTKQRSSDSRGQLIAYVTVEESNLVAAQLRLNSSGDAEIGAEALPDEQGYFTCFCWNPTTIQAALKSDLPLAYMIDCVS